MLRITVAVEEYLMIGEDIKIAFVGKSGNYIRVLIDAPKDVNILRSTVLEREITDPEEKAKLPKYYRQKEYPEKYVKKGKPHKKNISIVDNRMEKKPGSETG